MKRRKYFTSFFMALAAAAIGLCAQAPAYAAAGGGGGGQASITLTNCNGELCNANNTEWTLGKQTTSTTPVTGNSTVTWTATATRGATSKNFTWVYTLFP